MPRVIDVEAFKYDGATGPKVIGTRRTRGPKQRFIRGPLSLGWISRAAKLPGQALHVALWLSYQSGLHRSLTVKLRGQDAFGVTRWASSRALEVLEDAGLVRVERRPGKAPVVTLLGAEVRAS